MSQVSQLWKIERLEAGVPHGDEKCCILPRLQKSLQEWTETGNHSFIISDRQLWEEIYDNLSNAVLTREIVE